MFKRIILLLMLWPIVGNSAHITDKLLAGMYAAPNKTEQPIQLLPSGTPVELIGEQKDFVKVQLVDGKTGWVEKRFLSEEKPAKVRLLALQSKYRQLQGKLDEAEKRMTALDQPVELPKVNREEQQPNVELQDALLKANNEVLQLKEQMNQLEEVKVGVDGLVEPKIAKTVGEEGVASLLIVSLLFVIAVMAGVYAGMRIQDKRQLKKHGGFRI
ncbi:MAG: TIGR04211 family SH3 domain-containing protein [Cycloclasticus sp.]|nr:arylsulfatase [Cycloclasticus sp. 44_32_T64]